MDSLNTLIDKKTKELESLPKPVSVRTARLLFQFCCGSALLLLGFGIPGCVFDSGEGAWGGWTWMFWIGILLVMLTSVFPPHIEKVAKRDKSPQAQQLEKELSALRSKHRKLSSARKELTKVEKELVTLSPDRFGCKSTEELQKLRASRQEVIERIMGSAQTPDAKPRPIPARISDKVVGYVPEITPPEGVSCEDGDESLRGWCLEVAEGFSEEKAADYEAAKHFARERPASLVDSVVRGRGGVVVRFTEGRMVVICDKLLPIVPKQFLARLAAEGVSADTAVEWQKSAYRSETQKGLTAKEVLPI